MEKNYYESYEVYPIFFETISEKNTIHEYEKKTLEINLEKLSHKRELNQIR